LVGGVLVIVPRVGIGGQGRDDQEPGNRDGDRESEEAIHLGSEELGLPVVMGWCD
jgi:hypothetical protein